MSNVQTQQQTCTQQDKDEITQLEEDLKDVNHAYGVTKQLAAKYYLDWEELKQEYQEASDPQEKKAIKQDMDAAKSDYDNEVLELNRLTREKDAINSRLSVLYKKCGTKVARFC
ncbi:hypothetical protein RYZ26_15230 [Terasakiella sp. A23]|uniref:hypothetical protein n=1 Tax=Terasakiella sp. FCG-A23 TaxID=3080561 RepID=UPI0029531922|nr:hypothetical protein [Terasakiella sp. A23]MDV7340958.1 hypothetical protein [Terasakiella sp. A23]